MKKTTFIAPIIMLALTAALPSAHAARQPRVTVATLAGTYSCGTLYFSDTSDTQVTNLTIVVSRSGAVSGTGTIQSTDPTCDPNNEDGVDCTSERDVTFTMAKLGTPKKKSINHVSTLKRKTVDSTSRLHLRGTVSTFFASVRYRGIDGVASLGNSSNSLTETISCSAPTTLR